MTPNKTPKNRKIQMLADYLPLVIFFVTYKIYGIFTATACLIIASILAVGLVYHTEKRIPTLPLITAILVLIFGSATILLGDEKLIKLKSTVIQLLFALILFGSVLIKKPVLAFMFKEHIQMQPAGWRKMSLQYGVLFLVTAGLNEWVRLTQSTDFWVNFKVFGLTGIFFIFGAYQAYGMRHYLIVEDKK